MRRVLLLAVLSLAMLVPESEAFQRRRSGFGYTPSFENPKYDGAFMFCRIMFRNASNGDGAGWSVDWPRADINLSYRLSELTRTSVSRDAAGGFNHAVIRFTDAQLFR